MNAVDQPHFSDFAGSGQTDSARKPSALPVRDPLARLLLLSQLIATIDQGDHDQLADLLGCGFTPDLIQQLRAMTMADAVRFTADACGFSVTIDAHAMRRQFAHVERKRTDQQLVEYFVRHGATPRLMSALFRVGVNDVRRLRRLLAPSMARGGRPRTLPEPLHAAVTQAWDRLRSTQCSDRQRLWLLHQQFSDQSIASLESVVRPADRSAPPSAAGSRSITAGTGAARPAALAYGVVPPVHRPDAAVRRAALA